METGITVNRQKRKTQGNNVYLQNKTQFQIYIKNDSTNVRMYRVKVNGQYIIRNGIVMKPYEKVYLDRGRNSDLKLIFNTYEIDGDDLSKVDDINGKVQIEQYLQETIEHWVKHTYIQPVNEWNKIT